MAKKKLKELKVSKDVYWRRRAKQQSLAPVTDLSAEIRQSISRQKGTKGEVQAQINLIKKLEKDNREILKKAKDVRKGYEFQDESGKAAIDKELSKPDYRTKNLSKAKNKLRALQGKDFFYYLDDGFKKSKISTKTLKSYWNKGLDPTLHILKIMEKEAISAINFYNNEIESNKKKASKAQLKKWRRIRDGLQKKLKFTIDKNIQALETGSSKPFDEISKDGEKAYSILFKVGGLDIDRMGI